MIGGMCGVVKDVLPYSLVYGNRSILQGVNIIGLRRKNISNEKIKKLKETFDFIFKNEYYMENLKNLPEKLFNDEIVKDIVNFLNNDKKRPICTPLRIDENDW